MLENWELTMHLYNLIALHSFALEHADSRVPLAAWQLEAEEAEWAGPKQVRERYTNAVVSPNRIVFSLAGVCKLDVKAKFEKGILLIEKVWADARASKSLAGRAKK